jgi:hypothetical protein
MAACECSICTEEIKKETGQVTLACSHKFHLGCIGRWLMRSDSCPLCRGETVQEEKFLADEELSEDEFNEDEDDLDEDEEDDHSEIQIPEYNEEAHALWVFRTTFDRLDDGESIASIGSEEKKVAAAADLLRIRHMQNSTMFIIDSNDRGYESA